MTLEEKRARIQELQARTDLKADERDELGRLREEISETPRRQRFSHLRGEVDEEVDDGDVVQSSVRIPADIYDRIRDRAKRERIPINSFMARALEVGVAEDRSGAAEEVCHLARALGAIDGENCPAEHTATRKAYAAALQRHYDVTVGNDDSEFENRGSGRRRENGNGQRNGVKFSDYQAAIAEAKWPRHELMGESEKKYEARTHTRDSWGELNQSEQKKALAYVKAGPSRRSEFNGF